MEYTIELLEAEINSLKDEYKHEDNSDKQLKYSIRIVSHLKALKILKQIKTTIDYKNIIIYLFETKNYNN